MTPDHAEGGRGGSELWSLREDVQIEVEPGDGSILLRSRWGEVTVQHPSPYVREALDRMCLGPISLENVIGSDAQRDHLYRLFERLQPLIIRTLGSAGGRPLLSVVPMTPRSRFRLTPLPSGRYVRLSTFTELRTDGREYLLESPLSPHRVVLHRPEAVWLIGSLGRPVTVGACASAIPQLSSLATVALAYLVAAGMVVESDESTGGQPAFAEETGSPGPVVKPGRDGPGIPLHRPRWEDLSADPPLAVAMEARRSVRVFGTRPVTADELGDLLYRTARVRSLITPPPGDGQPADPRERGDRGPTLSDRPYPGGGACYELELYITIGQCHGIPSGIYHYDPLGHLLELVNPDSKAVDKLLMSAAECAGADMRPPVLVTMTARFQRLSWRYKGMAYAVALMDVGILMQSLYLVCTAMGLAPCAIVGVQGDVTAHAFGNDWFGEPSVGQFMFGRYPEAPPTYAGRWHPVNDAEWIDFARAILARPAPSPSS